MAAPNNYKKEPNKYAKNADIKADTLDDYRNYRHRHGVF